MIDDLVVEYLATRKSELETVRALVESGRLPEVKRIAHQLKGSGASYGFPGLTRIGRELEHAASIGDQATARSCVARLETQLASVAVDT